jgi:peptidoglycan/xylan/chitin deacetylase (PgdA/CDA1 family)
MTPRNLIRFAALAGLCALFPRRVPTVLMYHSIHDATWPFFTVKPATFERQLTHLVESGCRFVSMDEVTAHVRGSKSLPANAVCLTFDDGYRDNLECALPLLERFSAPATIFVASGYVESGVTEQGLPICSTAEIAELAAHPLVTIGAHTHSHPRLSRLSAAAVQHEISYGRARLEEWAGKPVLHFAYPKGDFNAETVEIVRAAGFASAVTVRPQHINAGRDAMRIGRVPVDAGLPFPFFWACNREATTVYTRLSQGRPT